MNALHTSLFGLRWKNGYHAHPYHLGFRAAPTDAPCGVGQDVVRFVAMYLLEDHAINVLRREADNVEIWRHDDFVERGALAGLKKAGYCAQHVQLQENPTWDKAIRPGRKSADAVLYDILWTNLKYGFNDLSLLADNSSCRHGYVLDLEEEVLEGWIGAGYHVAQSGNPLDEAADRKGTIPCARAFVIPFNTLCDTFNRDSYDEMELVLNRVRVWMNVTFDRFKKEADAGALERLVFDSPITPNPGDFKVTGNKPFGDRPLGRFKVGTGLFTGEM